MVDEKRELLKLLDLETVGEDCFAGASPATGWKRVFGGQVVAQALPPRTLPARLFFEARRSLPSDLLSSRALS
jgi:acyl-CoA thioesterase-2